MELLDVYTRGYLLFVSFVLGSIFASFLMCQADRIASKKDWVHGHSKCDSCGHELGAKDLIPIVSYVWNKGKCSYCGNKIPRSCLLGEVLLGCLFMGIVNRFGLSVLSLRYLCLVCILFGLSIVDFKTYEIPDGYIVSGIVVWFLTCFLMGEPLLEQLKTGLLGGFVVSGLMLGITLLFELVAKKEGMGGGDIKLFFMVGLYLGIGLSFLNLFVSCLIGLVFVVVLKNSKIPFGPSISIATYLTLLYGSYVLSWYLGLFI